MQMQKILHQSDWIRICHTYTEIVFIDDNATFRGRASAPYPVHVAMVFVSDTENMFVTNVFSSGAAA